MDNRLLTLDDAVKVAVREWDADIEIAKQEFEQKVWVQTLDDTAYKELINTITNIHPRIIADAIAKDKLSEWCERMQVDLQMLIIKNAVERSEANGR